MAEEDEGGGGAEVAGPACGGFFLGTGRLSRGGGAACRQGGPCRLRATRRGLARRGAVRGSGGGGDRQGGAGLGGLPLLALLARVHGLVGEAVGVLVLLARDPLVRDLADGKDGAGLRGERTHVGVLDLPAAGHLLDDELGVHADPDPGLGVEGVGGPQPGDEAPVLGDVVRGGADVFGGLGQSLAGGRVEDTGAVAGGARVAPGAAVGLDDERTGRTGHRPDSGVRTRIRLQFSQRTTESAGAARTSLISVMLSSRRQPSQRFW